MPGFGLDPISIGMQAASTLAKIGLGIHQNRLANKIKPVRYDYQVSPYAQNQYGLAQQLYNARMAGAGQQEQNIMASQGNMMANVNRNAGSSAQALAMAAAAQGQTNQAFANLGLAESQNRMNMLANLNQQSVAMTNELEKQYQDRMDKYKEDVNAKSALRNAAWQNFGGALSDIGNVGTMGMMNGGFNFKNNMTSNKSIFNNNQYEALQKVLPTLGRFH